MNAHVSELISIAGRFGNWREAEVVVTLPTFRRPDHLVRTLESLAGQTSPARRAVIVMENDAEGLEGANAAKAFMADAKIDGLVIIAHERGNCAAYNAGWQTALSEIPSWHTLLVIDDDELAVPEWIAAHLDALERFGTDIQGGPQHPVFDGGAPGALHPVFRPPYTNSGPVEALYSSGNLAIRRQVLETMPQPFLDLRFNFLGGGDSDFLNRAKRRGFHLSWCMEAAINETVPARRLERDWIHARAVRNGVISTLVERKQRAAEPFGRLRVIAKSLALLAASPIRCLANLASGERPFASLYPVQVAAGRILAEFGYAREQYRNAEKN